MKIPVFEHRFISSWGKRGDPTVHEDIVYARQIPLLEALTTSWPTDAHAPGYTMLGDELCPRIDTDALRVPAVLANLRMVCGYLDLDRPKLPGQSSHPPWDKPEDAHAAVALLAQVFPKLAIFATRGGVRMVYALHEPLPVPAFIAHAGAALRQMSDILSGLGLALEVDGTTKQWSRVFRLPRVVRDGKPTEDQPYFLARIPDNFGPLPAAAENILAATILPVKPYEDFVPPSETAVRPTEEPDEGDWNWLIANMAERLMAKGWGGLLGTLRAGKPFYEPGARNATTFRAVSAFLAVREEAHLQANISMEAVYGAFAASTAASTGTDPETALDELWGMVGRLFDAQAYTEDPSHIALPTKTIQTRHGEVPLLVYTGGAGRVVWSETAESYGPQISNNDSLKAIVWSRYGSRFPGQKIEKMSVAELLGRFGTEVDQFALSMSATAPVIETNGRGRTLVLPLARPVRIPAVYHPDCAEWLRILSGPDLDGVLSWLHWFPVLTEPIAALFLCGAPGTGKGMLALALAERYGGEVCSFDHAVGHFTGQMTQTPQIWLDETAEMEKASGPIRRLIANGAHPVEEKHKNPVTVRGHFRLIITANRRSALPLGDIQTMDDVTAILERVRFVQTDVQAKYWLIEKGGKEFTKDWVKREDGSPGRLAEHIQWVVENYRPLTVGSRFKVQGIPTPWHYEMLYSGAVGVVLALVAERVATNNRKGAAFWSPEHDSVLVNVAEFMCDGQIRQGLQEDKVDAQVARGILKSVCGEDELRIGEDTFLTLPPSVLRDMPGYVFRKPKTAQALAGTLRATQ